MLLLVGAAHHLYEQGFPCSHDMDGEDYSFLRSFKSPSLQDPTIYTSYQDIPNGNVTKSYGTTNKEEIRSLFDRWNNALLTGNPKAVADLYYDNKKKSSQSDIAAKIGDTQLMLLLPTLSNEPRTNIGSVEDYFVGFLKRKPIGRIISGQILMDPDGSWAHDAGIYEFVLQNAAPYKNEENGQKESPVSNSTEDRSPKSRYESDTSVIRARYSFFYLRDEEGEWKIAHHHSSLMPERKAQRSF